MSGLYIHIPFCPSRCIYCDFYSQTDLSLRDAYVEAVCKEIANRLHEPPATIYLGGGTPTQLTTPQLTCIFQTIERAAGKRLEISTEVTIEANPDDLTVERIDELRRLPITRLSLGIQTFDDARLRFLHRRHTASQAIDAVHLCQAAGFDNLSIDLIFGFPNQALSEWKDDLRQATRLNVQHISAYALSYEEGTRLTQLLKAGQVKEVDEELSIQMYDTLCQHLHKAGYEHYEISNFAKPGFRSCHNSAYWTETPYLGIGAGAHSFDGHMRSWNPPSISHYINRVSAGDFRREGEVLTPDQRFNERVMTRLRTREGLPLKPIAEDFGEDRLHQLLLASQPHIAGGRLTLSSDEERLLLTHAGIFVSNDIISDLMA